MNKKLSRTINLLLISIFSLVAIFAIVLTVTFIKPPPYEEDTETLEETIEKVEKDKNESQVGNESGNLIQHYNGSTLCGLVESDNKYIYKYQIINNNKCLTKTNIETKKMDIILTGYEIKSLSLVKDNLYMIVEQYVDEEVYQMIGYININNLAITTIKTTQSKEIVSFTSDGDNIYYTIKDDFYIYKVDSDNAVEKLFLSNKKGETPFILGINDGKIYYVNGIEMCTLGIHSHKNTIISSQYCSIEQYPILTKDKIICFQNLAHTKLDILNLDGTYKQTVLDETKINTLSSRIKSINYSCGYIFLLTDNNIYYLNKQDFSINQLKEAIPKTNQMYFTDEYVIIENTEYGEPLYYKIVWLLAS